MYMYLFWLQYAKIFDMDSNGFRESEIRFLADQYEKGIKALHQMDFENEELRREILRKNEALESVCRI